MVKNIEYLVTLSKMNGDVGKLLLAREDDMYKTEWSECSTDEEELLTLYYGAQQEEAWLALETLLIEKIQQGYHLNGSLLNDFYVLLPPRYAFSRKLEFFSSQHFNQPLFEELKAWRKKIASAKKIPPYFIATDKLLRMISAFPPHNEDQILQLPGIGQQKFNLYGQEILTITKSYEQSVSFPLDWVEREVQSAALVAWMISEEKEKKRQKEESLAQERSERIKLLNMIENRVSIQEAAQRFNQSFATILKRLEDLAKAGYEIDAYLRLQMDGIEERNEILQAIEEVGAERLKPVYEKLYSGSEVGEDRQAMEKRYNRIRLVRAYMRSNHARE